MHAQHKDNYSLFRTGSCVLFEKFHKIPGFISQKFLNFFNPKKESLLSLKNAVVHLRGLSNQFNQIIVFKAWPDCSVDSKIVGLATFIQQPPSGLVCSARSNSDAKQQSSN